MIALYVFSEGCKVLFYLADKMLWKMFSFKEIGQIMTNICTCQQFHKRILFQSNPSKHSATHSLMFSSFSAIIQGNGDKHFFCNKGCENQTQFDKGRLFKNRHYYHKWLSIKETFSRAIFMSNKVLYFRDTSYGLVNKSKVPAMLLLTAEVFISYSYE